MINQLKQRVNVELMVQAQIEIYSRWILDFKFQEVLRVTKSEQIENQKYLREKLTRTKSRNHHIRCIPLIDNFGQSLEREKTQQLIPIMKSAVKESTSGKNLICYGFLATICYGFGPKQQRQKKWPILNTDDKNHSKKRHYLLRSTHNRNK